MYDTKANERLFQGSHKKVTFHINVTVILFILDCEILLNYRNPLVKMTDWMSYICIPGADQVLLDAWISKTPPIAWGTKKVPSYFFFFF